MTVLRRCFFLFTIGARKMYVENNNRMKKRQGKKIQQSEKRENWIGCEKQQAMVIPGKKMFFSPYYFNDLTSCLSFLLLFLLSTSCFLSLFFTVDE